MAMVSTPRASGLWPQQSGYFPAPSDMQDEDGVEDGFVDDGRTPLDRTIDRIGMGPYQWTLLALCGFGWLADNMWLQAVAIILPRVQTHYAVPDSYIGTMSFTMFGGMMLGAIGWGACSDLMGRSTAFNLTLAFTALFGVMAGFTTSFGALCFVLFFLGSAVGGTVPTDGTLLLEHMPHGKQYLVTLLSVFFSLGSVLAAVIALIIIPGQSCSSVLSTTHICDLNKDNLGWKRLLIALGILTLVMFLARLVFFRLHESPRYLVHAGRPHDAVVSLQKISKYNGDELALNLSDVQDHVPLPPPFSISGTDVRPESPEREPDAASPLIFDVGTTVEGGNNVAEARARQERTPLEHVADYHATGESPVPLDAHTFDTPSLGTAPLPASLLASNSKTKREDVLNSQTDGLDGPLLPSHTRATSSSRFSTSSSAHARRRSQSFSRSTRLSFLPALVRRPLLAWFDRLAMVLGSEWRRTTLIVWAIWWAMALAFMMFNVFLPKLLETRDAVSGSADGASAGSDESADGGDGLEESLRNVVIFTLGGCPGAIVGAYLVESPLGKRWSLAGSTFITAIFCVGFVHAVSPWAVRASTVGISLSSTTMWAVLCGWTPEIFATRVRGTACGTATALSRMGGMIAPMLGGLLLVSGRAAPVYTSALVFVVAGVCVLMLSEDEGACADRAKGDVGKDDGPIIVH